MKKRIIGLTLAAILVVCLLPMGAQAGDATVDREQDLVEALENAVSGDTITMGGDISVTSMFISIPAGVTLTGPHTLTVETKQLNHPFQNRGIVACSVTVNSVGFINEDTGTVSGAVTVNGGTFSHYGGTVSGDISMTGGQFEMQKVGNTAPSFTGSVNISGGSFTYYQDITVAANKSVTVSGAGTFAANEYVSPSPRVKLGPGASIVNNSTSELSFTLNNGTAEGKLVVLGPGQQYPSRQDIAAGYGGEIDYGTFAVTADNGYVIDKLWVDGEEIAAASGVESYTPGTPPTRSIFATFAYTVNFNQPANGSLSVSLAGETMTGGEIVRGGEELTVTAAPDDYYKLDGLSVNGEAVTAENNAYVYTVGAAPANTRTIGSGVKVLAGGAQVAAVFGPAYSLSREGQQLHYAVEGDPLDKNAILMLVRYNNAGRAMDIRSVDLDLSVQDISDNLTFAGAAAGDSFRSFLLHPTTYAPLCPPGEEHDDN